MLIMMSTCIVNYIWLQLLLVCILIMHLTYSHVVSCIHLHVFSMHILTSCITFISCIPHVILYLASCIHLYHFMITCISMHCIYGTIIPCVIKSCILHFIMYLASCIHLCHLLITCINTFINLVFCKKKKMLA